MRAASSDTKLRLGTNTNRVVSSFASCLRWDCPAVSSGRAAELNRSEVEARPHRNIVRFHLRFWDGRLASLGGLLNGGTNHMVQQLQMLRVDPPCKLTRQVRPLLL